jgi:hypothetical protein
MKQCEDPILLDHLSQSARDIVRTVGLPEPRELDLEVHFDASPELLERGLVGLYRVSGLPEVIWAVRVDDGIVVEENQTTEEVRPVNSTVPLLFEFLLARSELSKQPSETSTLSSLVAEILRRDPMIVGDGSSFWEDYYTVFLEEIGYEERRRKS